MLHSTSPYLRWEWLRLRCRKMMKTVNGSRKPVRKTPGPCRRQVPSEPHTLYTIYQKFSHTMMEWIWRNWLLLDCHCLVSEGQLQVASNVNPISRTNDQRPAMLRQTGRNRRSRTEKERCDRTARMDGRINERTGTIWWMCGPMKWPVMQYLTMDVSCNCRTRRSTAIHCWTISQSLFNI